MEYIIFPISEKINLPEKGYFQKGDSGNSIAIISSFLAINFIGYESLTNIKIEKMLGFYFGNNLEEWIKMFQKQNNLEVDGNIGPKTLAKLRECGLSL